jgi:hypothetical protein
LLDLPDQSRAHCFDPGFIVNAESARVGAVDVEYA